MIEKASLVKFAGKEFATTLRVLNAVPKDQKDFRPHERSSNTITLISTFIFELYLIRIYLFGDPIDRSVFKTYRPDSIDAVISDFQSETSNVIAGLEKMSDAELTKEVTFAGRTFPADEFALIMVCDQIHHRGQLSVYLRLVGGKVPSIYGPSADDPTPNL